MKSVPDAPAEFFVILLRQLVEWNVSLLEINEKLAIEFDKDPDELGFDLDLVYEGCIKESLSRKAVAWGKANERDAKVKI